MKLKQKKLTLIMLFLFTIIYYEYLYILYCFVLFSYVYFHSELKDIIIISILTHFLKQFDMSMFLYEILMYELCPSISYR